MHRRNWGGREHKCTEELDVSLTCIVVNMWKFKGPTRCNSLVSLLQNLLLAQHVSGTIMPIIRSSRVIQMVAACGTLGFGLQVVGLVCSCGLCVQFAGFFSKNIHNFVI